MLANGLVGAADEAETLVSVEGERVAGALARHASERAPRLCRLWAYYRNPEIGGLGAVPAVDGGVDGECAGWAGAPGRRRVAQEFGLPARLRGGWRGLPGSGPLPDTLTDDRSLAGREVVIENDIGWRVDTMVDFLFGRPVRLLATGAEGERAALIERVLERVWEASGGAGLLQDAALLGHIYGFVDLALRFDEGLLASAAEAGVGRAEEVAEAAASALRVEVIEPTRSTAVVSASDYRRIEAYAVRYERDRDPEATGTAPERRPRRWLGRSTRATEDGAPRGREVVTEVLRGGMRRVYVDDRLVSASSGAVARALGRAPVVHIQNLSLPFRYEGVSEVEQLIPLQDELNTRLSDRASRVTLQSFKMYLAKGLEGFAEGRVGPGQVWATDNPDAEIHAFGGDAHAPSESAHIDEVREAMDKVSGVPPLAGGVIRAKIGNLSSATALRITLMGLLAKTQRKRVTYGGGIASMSRMILEALDAAGVLMTSPSERAVRVAWADPVPSDARERIAAALARRDLGVPETRVLADLGEAGVDAGID